MSSENSSSDSYGMGEAIIADAHIFCGQFTTALPGLVLDDNEAVVIQELFGGYLRSAFCLPSCIPFMTFP